MMLVSVMGSVVGQRDEQFLGSMVTIIHDVKGDVYSVGDHQIRVRGFTYDGTGPEAFILAGTAGFSPNKRGDVVITVPHRQRRFNYSDRDIPNLRKFDGEDVLL